MANINFYRTSASKVSEIEISKGNLIFVEDERTIYLDNDNERVAYQQIMYLQNDEQRVAMTSNLVTGFYFVLSTNILWRLDSNKHWIQITETPEQLIVYGTLETFERPGRRGLLYMTDQKLYHWDPDSASYVNYCEATPRWIEET